MSPSQLSSLMPLHYRHGFHSRLENLNRLLRYFLGGWRPTKTTHHAMSQCGSAHRLGTAQCKSGISLTTPRRPKPSLQSLPPILRIHHAGPIRSYSKAPGVFSSNYRYPASSPEVHFHRASPRDSSPLITPFVHVGIYPTRNCALRFLLAREGPYLVPLHKSVVGYDVWPLGVMLDNPRVTAWTGNLMLLLFTL